MSMKTPLITFAILFSLTKIFAGGILFEAHYTGVSPLDAREILLNIEKGFIANGEAKQASLHIQNSGAHQENLILSLVSRTAYETIFELRDQSQQLIAKLVTTGDCQVVEKMALLFPSGVTTILVVAKGI